MATTKKIKPFQKVDKIEVHSLFDDPDAFVDSLPRRARRRRHVIKVDPIPLDAPQPKGHTRFVCVSDTHGFHDKLQHPLPAGDVLLHCGDFTDLGKPEEVENFNSWLATTPHKHKIVIAGNHELSFDPQIMQRARRSKRDGSFCWYHFLDKIPEEMTNNWTKVLSNCSFLQDAEISVNGIRIYGTPWNPHFGGWAFNLERGEPLLEKWNKIPEGIDILMTHSPPAGHLDVVAPSDEHVGCVELLNTVQLRVKPQYHVFGHIHEAYGYDTDGYHKYINCSIVNRRHVPCNKPVIIDFPTPVGAPEGLGEIVQY